MERGGEYGWRVYFITYMQPFFVTCVFTLYFVLSKMNSTSHVFLSSIQFLLRILVGSQGLFKGQRRLETAVLVDGRRMFGPAPLCPGVHGSALLPEARARVAL